MIKSNTCLAVLRHNKKLYFAGDRRCTWGFHKCQKLVHPKISYRDGILYAGTGSSALCDEAVQLFNAPKLELEDDPYRYMHNHFLPAIIDHLRSKNYVNKNERHIIRDKDGDEIISAVILVGIKDQLFEVDLSSDIILVDSIDAPYAHGCGGQLALGALLAMEGAKMKPEEMLKKAIRIAAAVSPGCDAHCDVLHN